MVVLGADPPRVHATARAQQQTCQTPKRKEQGARRASALLDGTDAGQGIRQHQEMCALLSRRTQVMFGSPQQSLHLTSHNVRPSVPRSAPRELPITINQRSGNLWHTTCVNNITVKSTFAQRQLRTGRKKNHLSWIKAARFNSPVSQTSCRTLMPQRDASHTCNWEDQGRTKDLLNSGAILRKVWSSFLTLSRNLNLSCPSCS